MDDRIKCLARSANRLYAFWATFDIISAYKLLGWHLEQSGWLGPEDLGGGLLRKTLKAVFRLKDFVKFRFARSRPQTTPQRHQYDVWIAPIIRV